MEESTRQATRLWTLALPKVSAFVAGVVRDFKDRDDVLQEIAVAVIDSFASYDQARSFDAWAMGVAKNQVSVYLRKRRRHRAVFDETTTEHLEAAFAELPKEESQALGFLQDCLSQMDGRSRELCTLRYEQDLKPAAISEALEMTGTSVRKALQRVRENLRKCVDRKAAAEGLL